MSRQASRRGRAAELARIWSRLHPEQRVAGIASILLIVSTLGPFSFVEAAEILTALAVLALLKQRADGREFHLPFGDGTIVFAAGVWSGLLIATRIFDRPPGMTVLALVCALLLAAAGLRERAKRAPDDLPEPLDGGAVAVPVEPAVAVPVEPAATAPAPATPAARTGRLRRRRAQPAGDDETRQLSFDEDPTLALGQDDAAPDDAPHAPNGDADRP